MTPTDKPISLRVAVEKDGNLSSAPVGLRSCSPTLAPDVENDGELTLFLDCVVERNGELFSCVLGFYAIDPYIVAADLMGMADVLLRRTAIDAGLDRQAQDRVVRRARRTAASARRKLVVASEKAGGTTCDFCPKTARMIVEGKRYCKRHAEEHGVRPHGKIGDES